METTARQEARAYYDRNLAGHSPIELEMVRINVPLALAGDAASLKNAGMPQPVLSRQNGTFKSAIDRLVADAK